MVRRLVTLAVTLLASLAFGQLDPNSITVSATRSSNVQPDQAVFAVYVDAGINASLNDVLSAVQSVGITAANFSGVGSPQGLSLTTPDGRPSNVLPPPMLEWAFGLPVPLSKLNDTANALTKLQATIAEQKNGLALTFNVQGTQVSPQLQQTQPCSASDLLSDARAQAQKLADAAGLTLGPVLAMSSSTSANIGTPPTTVSRFILTSPSSFPPVCSVAVKFGVTRY